MDLLFLFVFGYLLLIALNLAINPFCQPICILYPKGITYILISKLIIILGDLGYNVLSLRLGLFMTYRAIAKIEKQLARGVDPEFVDSLVADHVAHVERAERLQALLLALTQDDDYSE
jgi:hypothetical protein